MELIKRLRKQAKLYDEIDAGTGYGYDIDANNIREAISVIEGYKKAWDTLKEVIPRECEKVQVMGVSKIEMKNKIVMYLLDDMRNMEYEIIGLEEENEPDM